MQKTMADYDTLQANPKLYVLPLYWVKGYAVDDDIWLYQPEPDKTWLDRPEADNTWTDVVTGDKAWADV